MKKFVIFSETITSRSESLSLFMKECNRYKVMDNNSIVAALKNGETEKVINANLRLVISIAKLYQNMGLMLDDLIQEGCIGLINACQVYDTTRGTMFTTCALEYIRKYITMALTEKGRMVRLPKHRINELQTLAISVDAPLCNDGEEGSKTMLDTMASNSKTDAFAESEATKAKLNYLLNGLKPKHKQIICLLFGIGCTECTEYMVAKKFNMCEERIRQIKQECIERMKEMV